MQAVAAENNLAETAFLVPEGGEYRLRWFTPAVEVPLCGHATLASAAVVMERLEPRRARPARRDRDRARRWRVRLREPLFRAGERHSGGSVTGAAHCMLSPYWATRLKKTAFTAFQASRRGGEVICRLVGDRVELEGRCVFYLEGEVEF